MSAEQSPSERELSSNRPDTENEHEASATDLSAQLEVLTEENQRLREEYARARRTQYRRTAVALAIVGSLGLLGGALFPDARTVLLALGGAGVFAAVMTYFLTPEQFISAEVGEGVYRALAGTETALVDELGLQDDHIYIPTHDASGGPAARLFVPQHAEYDLPDRSSLDSLFVIPTAEEKRGIAIHPTGEQLFDEFERTLSEPLGAEAEVLATQLTDGLIEQFELVRSVTAELDGDGTRVSVAIGGSAYGAVNRFDHPVMSFLGVGFAVGLDRAVTVDSTSTDGDRAEYLVTCSWSGAT